MAPVEPTLTSLLDRFSAQTPAVRWGAIALSCGAIILGFTFCARALEPTEQRAFRLNEPTMAIAPPLLCGAKR